MRIALFVQVVWIFFSLAQATEDYREVLDGAVVINLSRHIHRFEKTKVCMERVGFTNVQRFEAIDGFLIGQPFFEGLNIYTGSPGQKGCAASHLLVWENFLLSDKKWLFVAEDDMLPHSAFEALFPFYWKNTPKNFDIVMVGNQMNVSEQDPLILSEPCFCMHGYIISRKGAKKLLDAYKTIDRNNENMHVIDIFLINIMSNRFFIDQPFIYYCYNGTAFKDLKNIQDKNIFPSRDTGICFQNKPLGSTIHSIEIVH